MKNVGAKWSHPPPVKSVLLFIFGGDLHPQLWQGRGRGGVLAALVALAALEFTGAGVQASSSRHAAWRRRKHGFTPFLAASF